MAGVFSSLRSRATPIILFSRFFQTGTKRYGGHGHEERMIITPTKWPYQKFKDMAHFYFMLGIIPLATLSFLVNIFVGPAKLSPIPEGYWPEHQEYYEHPIQRFFVKYIHDPYQMEYEKKLFILFVKDETRQMKIIEKKVMRLIRQNQDVKAYGYLPFLTKYHKVVRDEYANLVDMISADGK